MTHLRHGFGVAGSFRGPIHDELSEQHRWGRAPAAATMCGIEECLWIRVASLLTPIEVGPLCRFRDSSGQGLAFAYRRLRVELRISRRVTQRVQGIGEGVGRRLRHGKSKVLRGVSGAGCSPRFRAPPVEACPNFSCRKRPCTINASASTRTTASKILSIVALSRSS
jgi:hypothetical protein